MSNIKILLRKNKENAKGGCPSAVRITQNKNVRFSFLGYRSKESDLDEALEHVKKTHPLYKTLNIVIRDKRTEPEKTILNYESNRKLIGPEQLKQKIKREGGTVTMPKKQQKIRAN